MSEAQGEVVWKQTMATHHSQKRHPAYECPRCEKYNLYEHREPEFVTTRNMTWKEKIKHFFLTFIDIHDVVLKPNREISGYVRYRSCENCGYSTEAEQVGEDYYE